MFKILATIAIMAILSYSIGHWVSFIPGTTAALLIGLALGNSHKLMTFERSKTKKVEAFFLGTAIVLLGTQFDVTRVVALGPKALLIVTASVVVAIALAVWLEKSSKASQGSALLIGVGTAICGSAAIAACAPLISEDKNKIGTAMGTVNLLGTAGMFILPFIVHLTGLTDEASGILIGSTLQAVGHVVAAGYALNHSIGDIATITKMGRVVYLVPMVLIFGFLVARKKTGNANLPLFLWGFLAAIFLASTGAISPYWNSHLKVLGKFTLIMALAAIGLNIHIKEFLTRGKEMILLGLVLASAQLVVVSSLLYCLK